MDETNGVTIGFREIYDTMTGVTKSLQSLEHKFDAMQANSQLAPKADERSKNNEKYIGDLSKKLEDYIEDQEEKEKQEKKDKIRKEEKLDTNKKWNIATLITIFIFIANLYF